MSWNDDERPSVFGRLRSLPTAVQVSGVITAGVVVIDLIRSFKDIVVPLIQLLRGIGSCA
jgi:hypothetical protein